MKTVKNKRVLLVAFLATVLGVLYILIFQLGSGKPPIVKSQDFYCSPDNCASQDGVTLHGKVDIYLGVNSKKQCIRINGHPITVWGVNGEEFYIDCGVHWAGIR